MRLGLQPADAPSGVGRDAAGEDRAAGGSARGGAFRRIGSTDQEGSDDDLIALYAGHQRDTYDATVVADADMADNKTL
jgi:predicted HTH transcriptional regulator